MTRVPEIRPILFDPNALTFGYSPFPDSDNSSSEDEDSYSSEFTDDEYMSDRSYDSQISTTSNPQSLNNRFALTNHTHPIELLELSSTEANLVTRSSPQESPIIDDEAHFTDMMKRGVFGDTWGILGYRPFNKASARRVSDYNTGDIRPSSEDFRIYLHRTTNFSAIDFFAFGGPYLDEDEQVHLYELPISPSVINPSRILPQDEVDLLLLLQRYLDGEEGLSEGIPVPHSFLIQPVLIHITSGGQCRERFPRLEYFLATAASSINHLRLNNFGSLKTSDLHILVSPGFPTQYGVGEIQCPSLLLIRVQFPPNALRHPLDTEESFPYNGCLPRYQAFLCQKNYHCFAEQLYRSAMAVFELLIVHFYSNKPPRILYSDFDWNLFLGKRSFCQVFDKPDPHTLYNEFIQEDSETAHYLDRIPYLIDVSRQITLFIQQLETFFRTWEIPGLKYLADTIPLNTNLDFNLNPFLDTEEAMYLTAAYDLCLREHFTMLAQEILRILRFEIPLPLALGRVRRQVVDKLEDPQWEYSLYDNQDPFLH